MTSLVDAECLFEKIAANLKKNRINLHSPLEGFVIKTCADDLAYIDNRGEAKKKYNFDFWKNISEEWLKQRGIDKRLMYSQSQHFPDFLFKVQKKGEQCYGGSLVELKDSKGASISSFNSTIPTKNKTLDEIDVVNGDHLVSKITSAKDGKLAVEKTYLKFERKCLYLIRTHRESNKVKVSLVDGSFFETLPKERLYYQMLMNILKQHLEKERIDSPNEILKNAAEAFSHITDQTIIAQSQMIEKASVKPRLRIMAEVHPEGNPHSAHYPQITEGSFNLILQSSAETNELEKKLSVAVPGIDVFSIFHKRNGEHKVFQLRKEKSLTQFE